VKESDEEKHPRAGEPDITAWATKGKKMGEKKIPKRAVCGRKMCGGGTLVPRLY